MTVKLNKPEILHRAYRFMKDYAAASYEMGQAQDFIRDFCEVFGFSHKRLVSFEQRVKKLGGRSGRIAQLHTDDAAANAQAFGGFAMRTRARIHSNRCRQPPQFGNQPHLKRQNRAHFVV